jgi:hypothetical protein
MEKLPDCPPEWVSYRKPSTLDWIYRYTRRAGNVPLEQERGAAMEAPWERAEVSCPNCLEILVLRPGVEEIWCQRCESGYDVMESRSPRDPERTVLVLSKKRQTPERA